MGNQEGKESDSVASAVAEWIDDDDEESDSKNDDESFASHSRSIHVEDETDTIAVSRSRSINIMPDEDEESEKGELTSHQRSIAFDILAEDERDDLMARGEPMLADTTLVGVPLDHDAEMDGLLVGATAVPVTTRKRRRLQTSTCRTICVRGIMMMAVAAIFIAAMIFGAHVVRKQKGSASNLRGDGSLVDAPSADVFKGNAAMSNTHGLDVHAGETTSNEDATDSSNTEEDECANNLKYEHNNQAGLNCEWVAQADTARRCANERILKNCPATCNPTCGGVVHVPAPAPATFPTPVPVPVSSNNDQIQTTEFPTEFPTVFPTFIPTDITSIEDTTEGEGA